MSGGWEAVVVGLLVAGAGAWAVRALVRSLRKPGGCSSCASGGSCPLVKGPGGGCHDAPAAGEGHACGAAPAPGATARP